MINEVIYRFIKNLAEKAYLLSDVPQRLFVSHRSPSLSPSHLLYIHTAAILMSSWIS